MTHPDEGRLRALLDDELTGAESDEMRAHLTGCAGCSTALRCAAGRLASLAPGRLLTMASDSAGGVASSREPAITSAGHWMPALLLLKSMPATAAQLAT